MLEENGFSAPVAVAGSPWVTVPVFILIVFIGSLGLSSHAQAKQFVVDEINNSPGYSMTVNVNGGKFLSETDTWGLMNNRAALFHCPSTGSVSVSVHVDHPGLVNPQVNGQDGTSIREDLHMEIDQDYLSRTQGVGLVNLTGWVEIDDEWFQLHKQFVFHVFCYKPLDVQIQNFQFDFSRTVTSYKMTPYFVTHDSGETIVEFQRTNWPDVGVQVTAESPLFVTPNFWERTNESGRKSFTFRADTDFGPFDEHGLWHVPVGLRAVKDQYELEYPSGTSLPYTVIRNVRDVWYLGPSGSIGDLGDRLTHIDRLVPGDRIQIGSRTTSNAYVAVEFINGQIVRSQSGSFGGFVATVKDDGLAEGTALLWLDVRNTVQELRSSPRRAARMLVYKAAGAAIDTALGVPDAVGYVSETPGGAASKHLAKWGEEAYKQRSGEPRAWMDGSASFNFFTDGTVVVENHAAPFTLIDESGRSTAVSSGSSRFVPSQGAMQGRPVPPLTTSRAWEAAEPGAWQIAPAQGSTIVTALPEISVTNAEPSALDWSSAAIRLDGVNITPWLTPQLEFDFSVYGLNGTLPASVRLDDGEHTLEVTVNTQRGTTIQHLTTFSVDLPSDTSGVAVARAYETGVWLSWMPPEGAGDFQVFRAASADGPYTLLNETTPLQQPGFFDSEPLLENHYRIEGTLTSGDPMEPLEVVAEWSLTAPAPPPPESVTRLRVEPEGDALVVLFDHSYTSTTRWRLERSMDGGATFESLLAEHEQTAVSGYRDRTVTLGTAAEYRITPVSADGGLEGTPAHVTATLPATPDTPSGLTMLKTVTGVRLQWDAYLDRRATALRVYRDSGSGFQLFSTLGTDAADHLDSGIGDGPVQYYMTAASDQTESPPTTTRGLLAHPSANEAATIRMADSEIWVREGSGLALVKVIRSGNLSESALVHYTSDGPTGGTAVPGEDYVPVSGTLWFAPGQTEAEIPVELLPDAEYNWPIDQMFYVWLYINDDVFGPSNLVADGKSTSVLIAESDVISFPDHDLGTSTYRSDGVADIVVQRAYPSERDISVAIVVDPDDPGDSVPGVDWVDTRPWQVSFEPGQPTAVLTLDLLDGGSGDRVLNLKLQDPQGGASLNEPQATLKLTLLDNAPPPRASVEVSAMTTRPEGGFFAGEMACVDITFVNRGAVPTTGSVKVEFMPPLGFGFPEGSTLDELIVSDPEMDCFYWSDPESDPTVTCMASTSLSVGQSGALSVAFEAGSRGHEEVPFHVSVGDFSRPPPDLAVCAAEENRPGCGTTWIPVLNAIFVDDFESRGAGCLQQIRQ